MMPLFADACYWIALLHRNDQLHATADEAKKVLGQATLVTTDEILTEVLNFYSGWGPQLRSIVVQCVEEIRRDARVRVLEQSRATFENGFALFKKRTDKEYSLTDCVSFNTMRAESLIQALTDDHHFQQEGFTALLRSSE
jgi:predicted nucleic acid-binding protein